MRRIFLGLLGCVIGAGVVACLAGRSAAPGPIYTVAQVQKALAQHHGAWAGRTISIQGAIVAAYYGQTSASYQCGRGPLACPVDVVNIPPSDSAHILLVPATRQDNHGAIQGSLSFEGSFPNGVNTLAPTYRSPSGDAIPTILLRVQPQTQPQAGPSLVTLLRKIPFLRMLIPQDAQRRYPALGVYRVRIPDRPTCSPAANGRVLCDDAVLQTGEAR